MAAEGLIPGEKGALTHWVQPVPFTDSIRNSFKRPAPSKQELISLKFTVSFMLPPISIVGDLKGTENSELDLNVKKNRERSSKSGKESQRKAINQLGTNRSSCSSSSFSKEVRGTWPATKGWRKEGCMVPDLHPTSTPTHPPTQPLPALLLLVKGFCLPKYTECSFTMVYDKTNLTWGHLISERACPVISSNQHSSLQQRCRTYLNITKNGWIHFSVDFLLNICAGCTLASGLFLKRMTQHV